MRLRVLIGVCAAGLATVGLGAAVALVWITTLVREQTDVVALAGPHVRAAQNMEVGLLTFERERQLASGEGGDAHVKAMGAAARETREAHAQAVLLADTPQEQQLLQEAWRNIDAYLSGGRQPDGFENERARQLDHALGSARALVVANEKQAERATQVARKLDVAANYVGSLVAVAVLLGIGTVLLVLRLGFYRPLLLIHAGVERFRKGRWDTRLSVAGPEEFRDVAGELNGMAAALESQREGQLRFLAGVAHDLRNPLQALRLGASSLSRAKPLPPEDKVREILGRMESLTHRINRMVEDLLDQTRVEAGHLELRREQVDLRTLLAETVELQRPTSERHELQTALPARPVYVEGDAGRLEQVVTNLLSNAIKYSPDGGLVKLSLELDGQRVWVTVADRGMGIPKAELGRIFEPFRRSSSARDAIPGVGLGLSVSRRIIQAHGGDIEVTSEAGKGSTFRFRLPVHTAAAGPSVAMSAPGTGSQAPS